MVARKGNVALINVTSMSGRAKDRQRVRVFISASEAMLGDQ